MGFLADIKFLSNIFRSKNGIVELVESFEKESIILEEQVSKLRRDLHSKKESLDNLSKIEEEINASIEKLEENIKIHNEELYELHTLDNIKFIRELVSEGKCEIYKLDLTLEDLDEHFSSYYGNYCYEKKDILKVINFKIQEFAAKKCISYLKLKEAIYDINSVWFETLNDNKRNEIKRNSSITELLLTSFLMIRKKEEIDKKMYNEL